MAIRKAALGTRYASVTDIGEKLRQARENRQAQTRLLDELDRQVQRRRSELDRSLADLPSSQRTPTINRATAGFRAELRRATAEQRVKHVREAARLLAEARPVRDHYRSSVQMLTREGLGSERRSRVLHQIEHSGPAELGALAEFAAATKDMDLGAALCARVARLAPSERPFVPQELAEELLGDQRRLVTLALMEIERLAEEIAHDEANLERGSADTIRALKIATMVRAEKALADGDLSSLDPTATDQQEN